MKHATQPLLLTTLLAIAASSTGCVKTETIFVPPTIPVRLGEDLHNVTVFTPDPASGKLIRSRASLRAGTWITYDPAEWVGPDGPTPSTHRLTFPN